MKNTTILTLITGLIFSCSLATSVLASTLYRYKDDNDRIVISNTVPADASNKGYEVLNGRGRVIKVVAPAPTAAELAEREARKERARAASKRAREDAELLRAYSHPDDAVRALRRQIQRLQGLAQIKRGNISVIRNQLDEQQSKAADIERSGQDVPSAILTRVDRLRSQIREIEQELANQKTDTQTLRKRYEARIKRLETITDKERTLEMPPVNTVQ